MVHPPPCAREVLLPVGVGVRSELNYRRAARGRWMAVGVSISPNTDNLCQAIKREIWSRELTIVDIAHRIGIGTFGASNAGQLGSVLKGQQRMTPGMLNRIIDAVHITPAVARRLHLLAAREAGWNI